MLVPSAIAQADRAPGAAFTEALSLGLAVLLIVAYGLGMLFKPNAAKLNTRATTVFTKVDGVTKMFDAYIASMKP